MREVQDQQDNVTDVCQEELQKDVAGGQREGRDSSEEQRDGSDTTEEQREVCWTELFYVCASL